MNKVFLIGNLSNTPELTQTPNGVSVCRFGIAVSRDYANAEGNRETDFFNIVVWRGKAENCHKYLKKGNKVGIVGKIENRSYTDKDGIKRNVSDIVAEDVEFLTPKQAEEQEQVVSVKRERPQLEEVAGNQLPF